MCYSDKFIIILYENIETEESKKFGTYKYYALKRSRIPLKNLYNIIQTSSYDNRCLQLDGRNCLFTRIKSCISRRETSIPISNSKHIHTAMYAT